MKTQTYLGPLFHLCLLCFGLCSLIWASQLPATPSPISNSCWSFYSPLVSGFMPLLLFSGTWVFVRLFSGPLVCPLSLFFLWPSPNVVHPGDTRQPKCHISPQNLASSLLVEVPSLLCRTSFFAGPQQCYIGHNPDSISIAFLLVTVSPLAQVELISESSASNIEKVQAWLPGNWGSTHCCCWLWPAPAFLCSSFGFRCSLSPYSLLFFATCFPSFPRQSFWESIVQWLRMWILKSDYLVLNPTFIIISYVTVGKLLQLSVHQFL